MAERNRRVGLTEALYTTRAMRRVKPDPVPEEMVRALIDAGVRVPTPAGHGGYRFMTVTDPETRQELGDLYLETFESLVGGKFSDIVSKTDERFRVQLSSSWWLAENFAAVPLWILVLSQRDDPHARTAYAAAWSVMLAARAYGLGTCLTTILGLESPDRLAEILSIPGEWMMDAAISVGYPLGRWGLAQRPPAHEITYANRWGNPVPWEIEEPMWTEPDGYGT